MKQETLNLQSAVKIAKSQVKNAVAIPESVVISALTSYIQFLAKKALIAKGQNIVAILGKNQAGNPCFRVQVDGKQKFQDCVVLNAKGFYKGRGNNALQNPEKQFAITL